MKVIFQTILAFLFILFQAQHAFSEEGNFLGNSFNAEVPPEVLKFEKMLGSWDVLWESIQEDGTIVEGAGKWYWHTNLDGYIIQDLWVTERPVRDRKFHGTTVRWFDPETGKWIAFWVNNFSAESSWFEGGFVGDEFIMYRVGQETSSRIRYFDITGETFSQQSEKSTDNGVTWVPDFKLFATRIKEKE